MQKWVLTFLMAMMLLSVLGCTRSPDNEQSTFERHMLKTLLDKEIAVSARKRFNASYDPKNGRIMRTSEIFEFLNERKVSIDSLPPSLQSALKEKRVVGVLVSRLDPIPYKKVNFVPVKLDALHKMLLAWEIKRFGASLGSYAMWFNGANGGGSSSAGKCPNDAPKCLECDCCTGQGCFLCVCSDKCPPCQHEICWRCPSDIPIVSYPEEEGATAKLFCEDPLRVSLKLSE